MAVTGNGRWWLVVSIYVWAASGVACAMLELVGDAGLIVKSGRFNQDHGTVCDAFTASFAGQGLSDVCLITAHPCVHGAPCVFAVVIGRELAVALRE